MSNSKRIRKKYLNNGSSTVYWMPPRSLETSDPSSQKVMPINIKEWLMSLPQDSPANPLASPENNKEKTTQETCGLKHSKSFVEYDQDSRIWKMLGGFLDLGISLEYSEIWPKAGIMLDGVCYRRRKWELPIREKDYGFSLLTPVASDGTIGHVLTKKMIEEIYQTSSGTFRRALKNGDSANIGLVRSLRLMLPTISVNEHKGSPRKRYKGSKEYRGAKASEGLRTCEEDPIYLNPLFAEWMMGWPIMWTRLKPLGMDKFLTQWLEPLLNSQKPLTQDTKGGTMPNEQVTKRLEAIFAHAVALSQSGRLKNKIYVIEKSVFIKGSENTVLLHFPLPEEQRAFLDSFSFDANDYDSPKIEIKDGAIIFKQISGHYNRSKICRPSEDTPKEISSLFRQYPELSGGSVAITKDILALLEDGLSHMEISIEDGDLKIIQRDIYSGVIIEIGNNNVKGLNLQSDEIRKGYDFPPIGIKTKDFIALFSFNDVLHFRFPAENESHYCTVEGRNLYMKGVISLCLFDGLGEVSISKEEVSHGRKEPQRRRRERTPSETIGTGTSPTRRRRRQRTL